MKLIKRIVADVRSPGLANNSEEMIVNEALNNLQTNKDGTRNDIIIDKVSEINKDSGITVFIALYEDKSLDLKKVKTDVPK
jgi:aspartyl-tRNA synthetase